MFLLCRFVFGFFFIRSLLHSFLASQTHTFLHLIRPMESFLSVSFVFGMLNVNTSLLLCNRLDMLVYMLNWVASLDLHETFWMCECICAACTTVCVRRTCVWMRNADFTHTHACVNMSEECIGQWAASFTWPIGDCVHAHIYIPATAAECLRLLTFDCDRADGVCHLTFT